MNKLSNLDISDKEDNGIFLAFHPFCLSGSSNWLPDFLFESQGQIIIFVS